MHSNLFDETALVLICCVLRTIIYRLFIVYISLLWLFVHNFYSLTNTTILINPIKKLFTCLYLFSSFYNISESRIFSPADVQ